MPSKSLLVSDLTNVSTCSTANSIGFITAFTASLTACTAGLFSQKARIASVKPVGSSLKSSIVKQTDSGVVACGIDHRQGECGMSQLYGVTRGERCTLARQDFVEQSAYAR